MMQEIEAGWSCPRCDRVWSPQIIACGTCNLDLQRHRMVNPTVQPARSIPTYSPSHFNPRWAHPYPVVQPGADQPFSARTPFDNLWSVNK